jgi:hypothetical protein
MQPKAPLPAANDTTFHNVEPTSAQLPHWTQMNVLTQKAIETGLCAVGRVRIHVCRIFALCVRIKCCRLCHCQTLCTRFVVATHIKKDAGLSSQKRFVEPSIANSRLFVFQWLTLEGLVCEDGCRDPYAWARYATRLSVLTCCFFSRPNDWHP